MSDTDRELLELAALAAGFQIKGWINDQLHCFDPVTGYTSAGWDPLIDDGDALRLAVKLNIDLYIDADCVAVACDRDDTHQSYGLAVPFDPARGDAKKCDATCRAITRAAAEIGRKMRERG